LCRSGNWHSDGWQSDHARHHEA